MTDQENRLRQFIAAEADELLRSFRLYVLRANLAVGEDATLVAQELMNDVVVEALQHAYRFDVSRSPKAWLLGIAANLIRRRQTSHYRQQQREPLARDLHPDETLSDDDLFDVLMAASDDGDPAKKVEADERVQLLLAGVSPSDRQIIELAILYDLNGDTLARALGITPGAARVRLHRALNRLRAAQPLESEV